MGFIKRQEKLKKNVIVYKSLNELFYETQFEIWAGFGQLWLKKIVEISFN